MTTFCELCGVLLPWTSSDEEEEDENDSGTTNLVVTHALPRLYFRDYDRHIVRPHFICGPCCGFSEQRRSSGIILAEFLDAEDALDAIREGIDPSTHNLTLVTLPFDEVETVLKTLLDEDVRNARPVKTLLADYEDLRRENPYRVKRWPSLSTRFLDCDSCLAPAFASDGRVCYACSMFLCRRCQPRYLTRDPITYMPQCTSCTFQAGQRKEPPTGQIACDDDYCHITDGSHCQVCRRRFTLFFDKPRRRMMARTLTRAPRSNPVDDLCLGARLDRARGAVARSSVAARDDDGRPCVNCGATCASTYCVFCAHGWCELCLELDPASPVCWPLRTDVVVCYHVVRRLDRCSASQCVQRALQCVCSFALQRLPRVFDMLHVVNEERRRAIQTVVVLYGAHDGEGHALFSQSSLWRLPLELLCLVIEFL
jgi:hypothetical protein